MGNLFNSLKFGCLIAALIALPAWSISEGGLDGKGCADATAGLPAGIKPVVEAALSLPAAGSIERLVNLSVNTKGWWSRNSGVRLVDLLSHLPTRGLDLNFLRTGRLQLDYPISIGGKNNLQWRVSYGESSHNGKSVWGISELAILDFAAGGRQIWSTTQLPVADFINPEGIKIPVDFSTALKDYIPLLSQMDVENISLPAVIGGRAFGEMKNLIALITRTFKNLPNSNYLVNPSKVFNKLAGWGEGWDVTKSLKYYAYNAYLGALVSVKGLLLRRGALVMASVGTAVGLLKSPTLDTLFKMLPLLGGGSTASLTGETQQVTVDFLSDLLDPETVKKLQEWSEVEAEVPGAAARFPVNIRVSATNPGFIEIKPEDRVKLPLGTVVQLHVSHNSATIEAIRDSDVQSTNLSLLRIVDNF